MTASPAVTAAKDDSMDLKAAMSWLRRNGPALALDIGVNFLAPLLVFAAAQPRWGDVAALLLSSLPPLAWGIGCFIRDRRVDALSIMAMTGIALSLLAFVGGGSPRLLELREKMVTLLIGLAFLGSAAIGKPLIYPLARATMARQSQEAAAAFDAKRDDARVRHTIMVMTLAWGVGLLADVALSIVLIFALSIPAYLIAGPILGYGTIGGLTLWTMLYRRHRERLGNAARAAEAIAVSDAS